MQTPVITKTLLVSLRKAVKLRSRKHSSHYRKTNTARSLEALGCGKLGNGHFGEAWLVRPGLVLKISGPAGWGNGEAGYYRTLNMQHYRGRKDAWPLFAEHCRGNPSKHLPTVYYTERLTTHIAFALMEELYITRGDTQALRSQWRRHISRPTDDCPKWLLPIGEMAATGRAVDLHGGNVLQRADGTIVLTDPFSYDDYLVGGYESTD